jgi:hypothetical protein
MPPETAEQAAPADSQEMAHAIEDKLTQQFDQADPPPKAKAAEPDKEGEEQPTPEFTEVEYEGETYQVPSKLKEAIIQKGDYTRKTQEVADSRRQIELQAEAFRVAQMEQAFAQTIHEPMRNIAVIESRTKALLDNWASLDTDQKQELLFLDKQREQFQRDIEGKRQEFIQGQTKAFEELKTKSMDIVRKSIPGWSPELAQEITKHALSDGYTQQEISSITDPRHVKTLWKARQFDLLQAKAKTPAAKTPDVVKPGASNRMPQQVKDNLSFRKGLKAATSSTEKARLIEDLFARNFERR